MSRPRRTAALIVAAALTTLCLPGAGAQAATMTACVKKSTGEMRLRTGQAAKRKCRKGWQKVTWNTTGDRGPAGLPGLPGAAGSPGAAGLNASALTVRDATGATVGRLGGLFPESLMVFMIISDGGLWIYLGSGQLYPLGGPNWKTNDCSGTAYVRNSSSFDAVMFGRMLGGMYRVVHRTASGGVLGPASAWRGTGATESVTTVQLYRRDSAGACVADGGPFTGTLGALAPVPAPPDFVGPLVAD